MHQVCKLEGEGWRTEKPSETANFSPWWGSAARGCHASPTRPITGESAGHGSGGGDLMGDSRRIMILVLRFKEILRKAFNGTLHSSG